MVKSEILKKMVKHEDNDETQKIADILTIATIKFADLLPYRTTDYIFDVEKFSSFEGKTGPYILYSMVRIKSILRKVDVDGYKINGIYSGEERNIYLKILEVSKVLKKSYNEKVTSYICEYLFELCSLFSRFYSEHSVSNETDENKKSSYVALLKLVNNVCSNLLDILAIEVPERM